MRPVIAIGQDKNMDYKTGLPAFAGVTNNKALQLTRHTGADRYPEIAS